MRLRRVLLLCAGVLLAWSVPSSSASLPTEQVKATVDQVVDVLENSDLRGAERRKVLSGLIRARFDFVIMSQRTLGQYWKKATDKEQREFVTLYSDLLEASYIGRIEAYSDETISYASEKIEDGRAVVATVVHSGQTDIPIDYRMVARGDEWFVYDVVVEEVSLIKNYRSSYGEIVRKVGYPGLFQRMRDKLAELQKAPAEEKGTP